MTTISRRNFLKISGITLGSLTLLCSGIGYTVTRTPQIETPRLQFGESNPQDKRILVTYATRAGSTAEAAIAIAETLGNCGFNVDLRPVKDKPSLDGYRALVTGSAIRMGNWLPEAMDFIEINQAILRDLPVILFSMHLQNLGDDEESRSNRLAYLDEVRKLVEPLDAAFFPGKFDMKRLSPIDRWIANQVGGEERDLRNFPAMRAWAAGLKDLL